MALAFGQHHKRRPSDSELAQQGTKVPRLYDRQKLNPHSWAIKALACTGTVSSKMARMTWMVRLVSRSVIFFLDTR